ncbi:GNAT family N-acetyltransferase, partial [Micromonospora echinofusca]|nr:GNAT family N-acetyltransferase [Micromonospora echinofusca]
MRVHAVHDRDELATLLSHHPTRHAYELGDLDDLHWPHTTWYRHHDLVALLYHSTP